MSRQSQLVTFDVTCPEPRAWLVVTGDNREPSVVEMCQQRPSKWSATAELIPGDYLCRYYGGDDRRVIYCGAASTEGSIECGMDALISVRVPEEAGHAQAG